MTVGCSGGDEPEEPVAATSEAESESDDAKDAELAKKETSEDFNETEEVEGAEDVPVEEVDAATAPEPSGFVAPKVWKYVTSFALNVRSAPDKENSSVIRHVKWGDKVEVIIDGEWAKLGNGEYISAKFLSDSDPALRNSNAGKKKVK